ncbi:MAG: NAD(P)-dependent oxidoreductase, partial [Pseudomonadota bacterium]
MAVNETLGFVGLGVMGEPMCANLLRKSGKTIHGFDVMEAPLQRLSELGLKPAENLRKIAAECDVVFLSLPSGKQVEEVCLGEDGLLAEPGRLRTIVDLSTCPASLARSLEKDLKEKGIAFVDAPVARMRKAAHDGTLAIMVGGDGTILEAVRPYLSCMGTDIIHCGDIGAGQVVKALNNMIVFMNVHALA